MGAHSLGHTHIEVSGYGFRTPPGTAATDLTNAWDHTPAVLDNDYYIMLLTQVGLRTNTLLFRYSAVPILQLPRRMQPICSVLYPFQILRCAWCSFL
jgi:hypothetical protein